MDTFAALNSLRCMQSLLVQHKAVLAKGSESLHEEMNGLRDEAWRLEMFSQLESLKAELLAKAGFDEHGDVLMTDGGTLSALRGTAGAGAPYDDADCAPDTLHSKIGSENAACGDVGDSAALSTLQVHGDGEGKRRYHEFRCKEPSKQRTVSEATDTITSGQANLGVRNPSVKRRKCVIYCTPKAFVISKAMCVKVIKHLKRTVLKT